MLTVSKAVTYIGTVEASTGVVEAQVKVLRLIMGHN